MTTTIRRDSTRGIPVSVVSANAPLTELTANQPRPAITVLSADGRMLPRLPNAVRPMTIWASPSRGPHVERMPWVRAPRAVPNTRAVIACQKPSPKNAIAITPTKMVANSRLGAVQVASSCHGEPCRRSRGIASMPPASTVVGLGRCAEARSFPTVGVVVMRASIRTWPTPWPAVRASGAKSSHVVYMRQVGVVSRGRKARRTLRRLGIRCRHAPRDAGIRWPCARSPRGGRARRPAAARRMLAVGSSHAHDLPRNERADQLTPVADRVRGSGPGADPRDHGLVLLPCRPVAHRRRGFRCPAHLARAGLVRGSRRRGVRSARRRGRARDRRHGDEPGGGARSHHREHRLVGIPRLAADRRRVDCGMRGHRPSRRHQHPGRRPRHRHGVRGRRGGHRRRLRSPPTGGLQHRHGAGGALRAGRPAPPRR